MPIVKFSTNKTLLPSQIEANEAFFTSIISLVVDGGMYVWKDKLETFFVSNGKLHGSERGIRLVKQIVSEKFFNEKFVSNAKTNQKDK